jgi:hypothetical protein
LTPLSAFNFSMASLVKGQLRSRYGVIREPLTEGRPSEDNTSSPSRNPS